MPPDALAASLWAPEEDSARSEAASVASATESLARHYDHLIASLDEARVMSVFFNTNALVIPLPDYARAFLVGQGVNALNENVQKVAEISDQRALAARIWSSLCARAQALGSDGHLLSPLRAKILEDIASAVSDAASADLEHNREGGYGRSDGAFIRDVFGASLAEFETGNLDLGPGVRESFTALLARIRAASESVSISGLEDVAYRTLWPFVVRLAPIAGDRSYSGSLLPFLVGHPANGAVSPALLFANPAWNEEGFRGMLDTALSEMDVWMQRHDMTRVVTSDLLIALLDHAKSRSWSPDHDQVLRLEYMASDASAQIEEVARWKTAIAAQRGKRGTKVDRARAAKWDGGQGKDFMRTLAHFPGAADSEPMRRAVMTDAGSGRYYYVKDNPIFALLSGATGASWLEVASAVAAKVEAVAGNNRWMLANTLPVLADALRATPPSVYDSIGRGALKPVLERFARLGDPVTALAKEIYAARKPEAPSPILAR